MIRAMVFDLDKTLLRSDRTISLKEVKAAADFVTASNDADGVAGWLEAYAGI